MPRFPHLLPDHHPDFPKQVYDEIVRTANFFMYQAKGFSISFLAGENPTYGAVSELLDNVLTQMTVVGRYFEPMILDQARDYVDLMKQMAIAIDKLDEIELDRVRKLLEAKPGVPHP